MNNGYLILNRAAGQSIDITLEDGRRIEIYLMKAYRDTARLGIRAPATVQVDRREVTLDKEQRNA